MDGNNRSTILLNVLVQENGIIRNIFGRFLGRLNDNIEFETLRDEVVGQNLIGSPSDIAKIILKQGIKDASLLVKISAIKDLHPTTLMEVQNLIHQIQNILIAEYVRYTELKDEIGLQ